MPRRPELYRMAMLDLYCDSFPIVPSHLTLDLDESFDRGEQELRKFNAYYDDFLPIHIFDTSGRLVVSVLREAATPSDPGPGQAGGRPSVRAVPAGPDPSARRQPLCLSGSDEPPIALRSGPEDTEARLCRGCEARGIEYIFGLAGTAPLAAQVQTLEARTAARYAARPSHPSSSSAATWTSEASPGTASAGSGRSRARWGRHPLHRHQPD
jgi:hypothetical protein